MPLLNTQNDLNYLTKMFKFIYPIFLIIIVYIGQRFLVSIRKSTTEELYKVLYQQNNPNLYLILLENPRLRILYKKATLLLFKLDALLLFGDAEKINILIEQIDLLSLSKSDQLEFNQKKLSYFCTEGYNEKAFQSLQQIERILMNKDNQHFKEMLLESKLVYSIYIEHKVQLISQLSDQLVNQSGIKKGITLFRIAKLYYFKGNLNVSKEYLIESLIYLKGTYWYTIANLALDDISILKIK
jgi:hypothetical protein